MNITYTLIFTWFNHAEHYKSQLLVSKRIRNKIILFFSLQRRPIKKRDFVGKYSTFSRFWLCA